MISRFFVRWIASAVALYLTVYTGLLLHLHLWLARGVAGLEAAFAIVAVLAVINGLIRPVVRLVALPLTCLTFGLFGIVINAGLFWLAGQYVPGFSVRGFLSSVYGSCVMAMVSALLSTFVRDKKDRRNR